LKHWLLVVIKRQANQINVAAMGTPVCLTMMIKERKI
jgi:hypothetical protein